MKEINEELLGPADLWEVHMGLRDELEVAGRNRALLSERFGEVSAIANAARVIELSIDILRDALLTQIEENSRSGATDAAIDAAEAVARKSRIEPTEHFKGDGNEL